MQNNNRKAAPPLEQFKAEVGKRAQEIFLKRQETRVKGDALSDWLLAEKEIKRKYRLS
jgi:hypothetical protein